MEDGIDFGCKLDSVMDEREIEVKGMFKGEIWGKECLSSRDLKRHQGIRHQYDKALPENGINLTVSEFSTLVERCS